MALLWAHTRHFDRSPVGEERLSRVGWRKFPLSEARSLENGAWHVPGAAGGRHQGLQGAWKTLPAFLVGSPWWANRRALVLASVKHFTWSSSEPFKVRGIKTSP